MKASRSSPHVAGSPCSSSSSGRTGSPSPSLSSFPITPTTSSQSTEPPSSPKLGFVYSATSTLAVDRRSPFASSSSSSPPRSLDHVDLHRDASPSSSFNLEPSSPCSSSSSSRSPYLVAPIEHCYAFMSSAVVDAAEHEDSCPICLELLSLRLHGERPHVVPVCGHRLHHSCFEAVYGDVSRAKSKSSGSLGLCGVCRRDMKIGDGSEGPGKANKFAKLSGLPTPAHDDGPASFKLRSRSRGTLDVDPNLEDDDLVENLGDHFSHLDVAPRHHHHHHHGGHSAGSKRGSAETYKKGFASQASSTARSAGPSGWDIVRPVVTVRAEHATVERTLERDKKQYLTCMVSVEMPSRWPTPAPDVSPFDDSHQTSLLPVPPPPPPASSSILARSNSSTRSAPRSASPTPSSVYSAYQFGPTQSSATATRFSRVVEDLHKRMVDWKGHSLQEFGQLKLYDYINVRKDTARREFLVYLFDEAILCVADDKRKGLGKLADAVSGNSDKLRLKGRVYVRHIRNVVDTSRDDDLSLTITMSDDAVAEFVMLFKERTSLEVWKAQIEHLVLGHSQPSPPPPPPATPRVTRSASSSEARKYSIPPPGGDSLSESSSIPSSLGHAPSDFSAYTRTTSSSLAPLSALIRDGDDACDQFGQFAHEHQQNQPGYASSSLLAASPSARSLDSTRRGGGGGTRSPLDHLAPRQFTPLDLMLIVSVPSAQSLGPTSLKLGIVRNSLEFVVAHVGPRTRVSLVAYTTGEGPRGALLQTPFLAVGKAESRARLERAIAELGTTATPAEAAMVEHVEERVNVVTACNLALDIVLQRKSKSALTGMVLVNDGRDGAQKQQMDLVMARAEAANVPIHTLGYGKTHDPSSLWLLSNHTGGSYTFVKDFYDLRDALAGCVGGILSVAATNVRLHMSVPEKRWFKIRKVSGTPGAIVASSGANVDVELGELRFGERKDLIVEVELSLNHHGRGVPSSSPLGDHLRGPSSSLAAGATATNELSATEAFFLAQAGVNPSTLDASDYWNDPIAAAHAHAQNLYDDEYDSMPDEVALFEVNAAYRDPLAQKSVSRLNQTPCLLTITVTRPCLSSAAGSLSSSRLDRDPRPESSSPEIVRRRMELLVSDMLSRALLLMTRRQDHQAARLLEETKRIISTISGTLAAGVVVGAGRDSRRPSIASSDHSAASCPAGQGGGGLPPRRSTSFDARLALARTTLVALGNDVDSVHAACVDRARFESGARFEAAQQAVVLRDQRAWTNKSLTERLFWRADNSTWLVHQSRQWLSTNSGASS